ncbi:MAG: hypothetical protein Q9225_007362 [Loekoesia sp. 1 TL-2023]
MSTSSQSKIVQLAKQILENTSRLDEYLQQKNLPSPSFDEDGPVDFGIESEEIEKAREVALDSSLELYNLLLGPALCLRPVLNGVSLQAIYKYNIASKVPLHGEISFRELADQCGLDEVNLCRMLRFAMAYHHVFQEPRRGFVAHSAASRKLAEDPLAKAGLGYMFDEVWQAFAQTIEAKEKFGSDDPFHTGWSLSQHTEKPVWEHYGTHPEMAKRFSGAMSTFTNGAGLSPSFLVNGYPWSSIGNGTGTVVDVGGSKGNISVALARSVQKLEFVVQDLPSMIDGAKDTLPDDVADRIEFMAYDFFTEQPLEADVYLFRNIFHNWSDSHVIKILQATVPALKPGARVVANDYLIPEPKSMSPSKEREIRYVLMFSYVISG